VRCSDFRTTDLAQDWFLTNGGPDRDRSRLDPDGDGFACNWSPERYRAEAREASRPCRRNPSARSRTGEPLAQPRPRRDGLRPELVVLHYTAMTDAGAAERALCDPAREVSCHWLIARDGTVTALVDEERRAWHAGAGSWGGRGDVNSRSIGIELDNDGPRPSPPR
jgi:N-acetyl-anhydromuramyl-L-alanine amidase AmpD